MHALKITERTQEVLLLQQMSPGLTQNEHAALQACALAAISPRQTSSACESRTTAGCATRTNSGGSWLRLERPRRPGGRRGTPSGVRYGSECIPGKVSGASWGRMETCGWSVTRLGA